VALLALAASARTVGPPPGNTGLLRDGGKLQWPLVLQDTPFATERKEIDAQLQQAVEQATK
jgi:hypothetical protein